MLIKIDRLIAISFVFVFFILKELYWILELFGIKIFSPYIAMAVLAMVYIFINAYKILINLKKIQSFDFFYGFFMLYLLVIVVISTFSLKYMEGGLIDETTPIVGTVVAAIGMFLIVSDPYYLKFIEKYNKKISIILIFLMILPLVLSICLSGTNSIFSLRHSYYFAANNHSELLNTHRIEYQSFGEVVVLLTFSILPYLKNFKLKILLIFILMISVSILGSKAAFIGVFFVIFMAMLISIIFRKRGSLGIVFIFCFLLGVLFVLFMMPQYGEDFVPIRALYNAKHDQSLQVRQQIAGDNAQTRLSRLFVGDFKYEIKQGMEGFYTHNILDIIDQYGIVAFMVYLCSIFYLLINLVNYSKNNKNPIFDESALLCLLYWMLLVFFIRSPINLADSYVIGICSAYLKQK